MKQETMKIVKEHKLHVLFTQAKLNKELGTETTATTKGYNLLEDEIKELTTENILIKNRWTGQLMIEGNCSGTIRRLEWQERASFLMEVKKKHLSYSQTMKRWVIEVASNYGKMKFIIESLRKFNQNFWF